MARAFGSVPESEIFNQGLEDLSQVKLEDPQTEPSNVFEQYEIIKKALLYLAKSNEHYKGEEFSPDPDWFQKVDTLPELSPELTKTFSSSSSPPIEALLSLKLSNRPVLGPYRSEEYGFVYIGQFEDGQANGLGILAQENLDGYQTYGYFVDTNQTFGLAAFHPDTTYFGSSKDGSRHGSGIFRNANGVVYEGEFEDNAMHGQGTYTWPEGKKYTGEMKDDAIHGVGVMTFSNGDSYDGELRQDLRQGRGVYTW